MNLEEIIKSSDTEISNLGKRAEFLLHAYQNGKITKNEYDELVNDLLDVKKIEKLAKTAERKALLYDIFQFLKGVLVK